MANYPGELSDTLEQFIFATDLKNGHMYRGRNHVGDFKKENDVVYFRGVCADDDWVLCNPHPKSLFKPNGFITDVEEELDKHKLQVMMEYVFKQVKEGYTEGHYPRWEFVEDKDAWTIKISKQGAM